MNSRHCYRARFPWKSGWPVRPVKGRSSKMTESRLSVYTRRTCHHPRCNPLMYLWRFQNIPVMQSQQISSSRSCLSSRCCLSCLSKNSKQEICRHHRSVVVWRVYSPQDPLMRPSCDVMKTSHDPGLARCLPRRLDRVSDRKERKSATKKPGIR